MKPSKIQPLKEGQHLMTKDGRVCGNAIVLEFAGTETLGDSKIDLWRVESDYGQVETLSMIDILSRYHLQTNGFAQVADYRVWAETRRSNVRKATHAETKRFKAPAEDAPAELPFNPPAQAPGLDPAVPAPPLAEILDQVTRDPLDVLREREASAQPLTTEFVDDT